MKNSIVGGVPIVTVVVVSLGFGACTGEPGADAGPGDEEASIEQEADLQAEGGSEDGEARGEDEHQPAAEEGGRGHGESGEEGGEHGGSGEEVGEYIQPGETWTETRRGIRLTLSFDPAESAFVGTVENTTQEVLCAIRVEVHLSSGTEVGPTEPMDLQPGESTGVELRAEGEEFDTWTAHPELSACSGG